MPHSCWPLAKKAAEHASAMLVCLNAQRRQFRGAHLRALTLLQELCTIHRGFESYRNVQHAPLWLLGTLQKRESHDV
jgi:hypothetical protein